MRKQCNEEHAVLSDVFLRNTLQSQVFYGNMEKNGTRYGVILAVNILL
jgi:hypothetical protein